MNHRWWLSAALALSCLGGPVAAEEKPHWYGDYEQARAAARAAGRPLFVVFRCEH